MSVRRSLPNRERTTIGAWCFLDHFGPDNVAETGGMSVAPHPHTGLQTVTWLIEGEVEHRDSVGSTQLVRPGALNLMTAGRGISHSEVSSPSSSRLHGVQLWLALPDEYRDISPSFEHVSPPRVEIPTSRGNASVTVFIGALEGVTSAARVYSPLVGAEIILPPNAVLHLNVATEFEHGVLVDEGQVQVGDEEGDAHDLIYLPTGVRRLTLTGGNTMSRLLLIGGVPFGEDIIMWWNFIGRSHEEVVAMRESWQSEVIAGVNLEGRFGNVDFDGPAIPAPEMPKVRLRARS